MSRAYTPTRQLFVRFPGRHPHDSRELERVFAPFGPIKLIFVTTNREVAYVTFERTADAQRAFRAHCSPPPNAPRTDLIVWAEFTRPTRLLHLEGYPKHMSRDTIMSRTQRLFEAFDFVWIDVREEKVCTTR